MAPPASSDTSVGLVALLRLCPRSLPGPVEGLPSLLSERRVLKRSRSLSCLSVVAGCSWQVLSASSLFPWVLQPSMAVAVSFGFCAAVPVFFSPAWPVCPLLVLLPLLRGLSNLLRPGWVFSCSSLSLWSFVGPLSHPAAGGSGLAVLVRLRCLTAGYHLRPLLLAFPQHVWCLGSFWFWVRRCWSRFLLAC